MPFQLLVDSLECAPGALHLLIGYGLQRVASKYERTGQVLHVRRDIGVDIIQCNATFRWSYARGLADDEWFALRLGIGEPHSRVWVKDLEYTYTLKDPGLYTWEIAVCRGAPETAVCEQLAVSEQQVFEFRGCGGW